MLTRWYFRIHLKQNGKCTLCSLCKWCVLFSPVCNSANYEWVVINYIRHVMYTNLHEVHAVHRSEQAFLEVEHVGGSFVIGPHRVLLLPPDTRLLPVKLTVVYCKWMFYFTFTFNVLRFIYTERKRFFPFDLCHYSIQTVKWILTEPIWNWCHFCFRANINEDKISRHYS